MRFMREKSSGSHKLFVTLLGLPLAMTFDSSSGVKGKYKSSCPVPSLCSANPSNPAQAGQTSRSRSVRRDSNRESPWPGRHSPLSSSD
jgi:hypothetical protein